MPGNMIVKLFLGVSNVFLFLRLSLNTLLSLYLKRMRYTGDPEAMCENFYIFKLGNLGDELSLKDVSLW